MSGLKNTPLRAEIFSLVAKLWKEEHGPKPFVAGATVVPASGRTFGKEEIVTLVDAALDFWLTTGRYNDTFESQLGAYLGRKYVLTTNSGSSANLLAVSALTSHLLGDRALRPGDEVITVATGFPTTVNPLLQNRLVPVFIDVDIPTYNVNVAQLETALTPRTRAIVLAHTLGNPFDLKAVTEFARRNNLWLIEDCCDALGSRYDNRMVGSFGDIGTLSFYPAHHITMGEGGAVFTANSTLKRALESLRDWGRDCWCAPGTENTCKKRFEWQLGDLPTGYDHKYIYNHVGYNLKITDMQAAVGVAQLARLEHFIAARKENFRRLAAGLADLEKFLILPKATPNADPSWFGFPITLRDDAPFKRLDFIKWLTDRKIGTRLLFAGNLVRQPYMRGLDFRTASDLRNSDIVMERTFWIGVFPGLSATMIDYVIDRFHEFARGRR